MSKSYCLAAMYILRPQPTEGNVILFLFSSYYSPKCVGEGGGGQSETFAPSSYRLSLPPPERINFKTAIAFWYAQLGGGPGMASLIAFLLHHIPWAFIYTLLFC